MTPPNLFENLPSSSQLETKTSGDLRPPRYEVPGTEYLFEYPRYDTIYLEYLNSSPATMASPALPPVRPGWIDPRRPGEYPIVLGDSLKGKDKSNESLVNVRYNYQPKAGFKSRESRLTKSGAKYQLVVKGDPDEGGYHYTGTANSQKSATAKDQSTPLALIFDKSKSAFVLESISTSLDLNLRSGPGQPAKDARELPQLRPAQQPSPDSTQTNRDGNMSPFVEDDTADSSNPYDFRHFLAEARDNIEKSTQPGNRTPIPGGGMTPISGISTPVPGSSRFSGTTPQFRPTPVTSKPAQQKSRKSPDVSRGSNRPQSASTTSKKLAKGDSSRPAAKQALSKDRITDSDEEDDEPMSYRSAKPSKPSTTTSHTTGQSRPSQQARGKGHARNISANIGSSPHIIINDDDLEIDMGSPPPEDRARRGRVDPEMFRSHTGTPIGGVSSNPRSRPPADDHHQERGRGRDRGQERDADNDIIMKITGATSSASEDNDEDGDVEVFDLGSPHDKRLAQSGGTASLVEKDDHDHESRDKNRRRQAPTPPAPTSHHIDDDDDDEDLLAAELEAALDEEDEEARHRIGLGIGMDIQDDESEVSEEE